MWEQTDGFDRTVLIAGTSYVLGAIAVLIVMLTFDLPLVVFSAMKCYSISRRWTRRWSCLW